MLAQKLRGHVRAIRPNQGVELGAESERAKVALILQRLEDRPIKLRTQIDLAFAAIIPAEPDDVVADIRCFDESGHIYSSGSIDFNGSCALARCQSISNSVNAGLSPFLNVAQGPARQTTGEDGAVQNRNQRFVFAIVGMEMRRVVVLVVHCDHDTQEPRYFRPRPSLPRSPLTLVSSA